ncbi:MAG: translation initiation factor eIF3 subunit g [Icmadophila ericetorum]|nr:translation initiation factor eIF3 subunit g [Icmadophila ericetorum]
MSSIKSSQSRHDNNDHRNVETSKVSSLRHPSGVSFGTLMKTDIPSFAHSRGADWADDEEFDDSSTLPPQTITTNKDGTKTIISYRFSEDGKRVKTTRRVRTTVVRETVNPRVAERKAWSKFGKEAGKPAGPQFDTTTVGENIIFRPSVTWKKDGKEGEKKEVDPAEASMRDKLKDKKVKCRICDGEHFTARCPFKDTMAPAGEEGGGGAGGVDGAGADDGAPSKEGGLGVGGSSYVPPHMRKGAAGGGDKMGGKYERDDLATLRVTNVSEFAEEQDLREIFERFGRVTRVFLAKDRETGRAKGFAFISFQERTDAAKACEKIDGYGYGHLILRVEFAKRAT